MGCEQVYCQSSSNQIPGINVVETPTGDGGTALNENFRTLQYRQPKCNYEAAGDPGSGNDSSEKYCIGSRWLDTTKKKMWICVNNGEDSAVWVPWFRWDDTCGDKDKSLAVDTNFAVDGEIRRIDKDHKKNKSLPLVLVPLGKGKGSALILGKHCSSPGGRTRGRFAVDLQTERGKINQVASGPWSFIAGGRHNRASGPAAHAEGQRTRDLGPGSHSEGFANLSSVIEASGRGAHAEGYAADYGKIRALGSGSHAGGATSGRSAYADISTLHDGSIVASGYGARAFGKTEGNGQIVAEGSGAVAQGAALGLAFGKRPYVLAKGSGAHALGLASKTKFGSGGNVVASGNGSIAMGRKVYAIGSKYGNAAVAIGSGVHSTYSITLGFGGCSKNTGKQTSKFNYDRDHWKAGFERCPRGRK